MFSKTKGKTRIQSGMKRKKLVTSIRNDLSLYIIFIPFLLHVLIFNYKPMVGLIIAFKDFNVYQGIWESEWVGLEHFRTFVSGAYFWRLLKNTFLLGIYNLLFSFPAPILFAILLNEVRTKKFKSFIQTATFLPHFVSMVVICGIAVNMLAPSGVINSLIEFFGGKRIYFMMKPEWFRTIYVATGLWAHCGYSAIIYLAAFSGIDPSLYEACVIDGGNKLKQILHVTIPGILPTIVVQLVISIGSMFAVGYEKIILLYQPVTYETADVISTYMYRTGLTDGNYDFATAVGLFNSIVSLTFVLGANIVSRKLTETALW